MTVGGTIVLARNELMALVYAIDHGQYRVPSGLVPLLPNIRILLMTEINRIDEEGNW